MSATFARVRGLRLLIATFSVGLTPPGFMLSSASQIQEAIVSQLLSTRGTNWIPEIPI